MKINKTFLFFVLLILFYSFTTNCNYSLKKSLKTITITNTEENNNTYKVDKTDINHTNQITQSNLLGLSYIIKDWNRERLKECDKTTCDPKYGTCETKEICLCKKGFASAPKLSKGIACAYKQKKQLTAFFLELFVIGAGHFYRGVILVGVFKLFFIIFFPCSFLFLVFLGIIVESDIKSQNCFLISSIVVSFIYVSVIIAWYLYDVINFAKNDYFDGNGVPLEAW